MVIGMGLSHSEFLELNELLLTSHSLRIDITVMDVNHRFLGSISRRFLGGQVDVDADADVTRSLKLDLYDPDSSLSFDTENPNEGAMYLDRMIRVEYCVGRLDGSRWYDIPIFTGPVTKVNRDGVVLQVECQGKEIMCSDPGWRTMTYKRNQSRVRLMRVILERFGEQFVHNLTGSGVRARTARPVIIDKETSAWKEVKRLGRGARVHVFYNGKGKAVIRRKSSKARFTFNRRSLLDTPQVGFNLDDFYNAVEVVGGKNGKGKGKEKKNIVFRVLAKKANPLSSWSLRRGGRRRIRPLTVSDDKIKSAREAKKVAIRTLRQGLVQSVEVTATTLVIPYLEELDTVRYRFAGSVTRASMKKFSIPLDAGGTMSVGYIKRVRPSRLSRKVKSK